MITIEKLPKFVALLGLIVVGILSILKTNSLIITASLAICMVLVSGYLVSIVFRHNKERRREF